MEEQRPMGYEALAQAIILQAVDDFRVLQSGKVSLYFPSNVTMQEIENFLCSSWYDFLNDTTLSGKQFVKLLHLTRGKNKHLIGCYLDDSERGVTLGTIYGQEAFRNS